MFFESVNRKFKNTDVFNKSVLLLAIGLSFDVNAYISPPSMSSMGTDEIRTSDGASCRSEVGGNLIVYANGYDNSQDGNYSNDNKGVAVGVAYRFGNGNKRIDCSKLYDRELSLKDLEIQRMKSEIEQLKRMTAINQGVQSGLIPPPPLN